MRVKYPLFSVSTTPLSKGTAKMNLSLVDGLKGQTTPFLEDGHAIFLWHGEAQPALVSDITGWDGEEPCYFEPVEPGWWVCEVDLPQDAYVEYAFLVEGERFLDPFNPRRIYNGFGGTNNYFYMPSGGHESSAWSTPGASMGEVFEKQIRWTSRDERRVVFYQPPEEAPCPLVVVWDGLDYLYKARLPAMLDGLITRGEMQPVALALVENAGPWRTIEYACSEEVLHILAWRLMDAAYENLNLLDIDTSPGAFGVLGASMGGLMALFTGLRMPEIFGAVMCQSGAFRRHGEESAVVDLLRYGPKLPLNIWLDVGIFDISELIPANRMMFDLLRERGYAVDYREYPAGHNMTAWRNDVWRGFKALFPLDESIR